jgi:penicillin-binding protein 1B
VLVLAFGAGFFVAGIAVEADRTVRARFEGVRFRVPSRVYSAPMILYPGLDWQQIDLRGTLDRLGYRSAATPVDLPEGQYTWGAHRVRVHLRSFEHPSRPEPGRDIVLVLDGNDIGEIRAMPSGRELGAVLLEPEPLGAYYGLAREQRELVRIDEVPRHLIDAVLAVEDQRFETHPGIDLKRILGAMWANIRAGRVRQGGSTLTQQLVKNFFLTPERTFRRKFQEAVMALVVEARYDKREILESYLNEIYLGQRGATAIHGFGEATHLYFGKSASDLTVAESGLLAAIIQSPNGISPYRNAEAATRRRNLVLDLMVEQGRIDEETHALARVEPLRLASVTPDPGDARYFLDLLRRQLAETYDGETLTAEGLRIYSTLDRRLQALAAQALEEGLVAIEKRRPELAKLPPERRLHVALARVAQAQREIVIVPVVGRTVTCPATEALEVAFGQRLRLARDATARETLGVVGHTGQHPHARQKEGVVKHALGVGVHGRADVERRRGVTKQQRERGLGGARDLIAGPPAAPREHAVRLEIPDVVILRHRAADQRPACATQDPDRGAHLRWAPTSDITRDLPSAAIEHAQVRADLELHVRPERAEVSR